MAKGLTPTQRTMRELRAAGCRCAVVEKWNSFARRGAGGPPGIRQDLFGIVDVLALDPTRGFVGVQCCAGSGFVAHFCKLTAENAQASLDWLSTPGGNLEIWAWRKVKVARGGKAEVWRPRVVVVTAKMITEGGDTDGDVVFRAAGTAGGEHCGQECEGNGTAEEGA